MYSIASAEASGSTTSSSDPSRKTSACSTASSSGLTPSSAGMSGKTAAPAGTSAAGSLSSGSAISASGHGGDDRQLVAVVDRRGEVLQVADVLVVEVDVDEAPHL